MFKGRRGCVQKRAGAFFLQTPHVRQRVGFLRHKEKLRAEKRGSVSNTGIRAHAREKAAAVFQRTVDVAQFPQNGEIVVLKGVVDVDLRPDELRSARDSSRGMEGTACVFVSFPVCPLFTQPKPLFFVQSVFDVLQIRFD